MTRYMKRRQEWNQSNLQLFPRNMTLKSHFTHMCPAKIFVSIVYLLDQNKPHSCLTHVMAHYCSKHTSYWKFRDHWKPCPWCNACLEKDCAQHEATCTACTAVLVDTLRCSISLNDLCSELAAQKEKGHLMHSTIFNSDNPVDIHLSNPGDNAEELDLTTKNGNKQTISKANSPAEKLWRLLGYHWLHV